MALITRIKSWIDRECLTHTDLNAEFSNITDNIIASDLTNKGMIERATDAEVISGTDEERAVTPAGMLARTGTTARIGLVQLEDSHASVLTTKAACPKNVKEAYDLAGTMLTKATFDANTFIYAVDDNTPIKKTRAEILALLSGQAGADFALNTHKLTGVVDPTADQDAATKKYVDDNVGSNLWTDEGTYYYPSNWAYMRILDSNRLDIANPTAFTGGFPWNDNVTYSSSAGSMVNLGQESSSDGNPPLWVQKKFNKSSGSNTHFAGAGHFEVWKQSGATKSYVSALTGMITQECASGDAIGIHGRVKKSADGSGWAGWLAAYRQAGATTGSLYGLEVNVINNANPETFGNLPSSPADMALLLHATNSAHPSIAAMVIGADSFTNTFYNGILFSTAGVRNAAGNGVGINMYSVSPQYGIKFSAGSTAHIYYADTADGLRLLSAGHTISTNANSKNWYWKSGGDRMILSPSGNLSLGGTLTENAWTLDNKHMGRKWELIDSIRKAYMTHDGKKLDAVLQIKTKTKDKNDKTQIKYGKRPSDFIQIAIECIAELKERIAVLEKA